MNKGTVKWFNNQKFYSDASALLQALRIDTNQNTRCIPCLTEKEDKSNLPYEFHGIHLCQHEC